MSQIDEIVVTVRKKEENLQDVPIALQVFSNEDIERKGIRNVADIARLSPSIQFDESFAQSDTRVTVRGLSPTRGRQNIAFLIDGIDVSSEAISSSGGSLLINTRLIDVERIEVLLGPQMALYGRSAFNGAIQYITKDAADELETNLQVDVSDYNRYNVTGGISAPVFGDALGFRLNGTWWDEQGFYENSITNQTIGGKKGYGFALTLNSQIGDDLTLKFRTEWTDDEGAPSPAAFLKFNAEAAVPLEATELFDPVLNPNPVGIAECFNGQNGQPNFIGAISADNTPLPLGAPTNDENLQARSDRIMSPNFINLVPGSDLNNYLIGKGFPTGPDGDAVNGGLADPAPTAGISPYCEWIVPLNVGVIPDAKNLPVTLATNPATPGKDYPGFDRTLLRLTLVADWNISEKYTLTSLTGITKDDTAEAQDANAFAFRSPDAGPYLDGNVNTFSSNNQRETEQFSQEIRLATNFDGNFNATVGGLYWHENVDQKNFSVTAESSGSHCFWNSQLGPNGTTNPLGIDDGCTGFTETPVGPYQNAAQPFRPASPSDRETDHWSIYGLFDFDLSETWTVSFEGRYSKEDVEVEGPLFYDPGASGGPGGLNPCGIFFRACEPFMQWLDGGNWFADAYFPYTDEDANGNDFPLPEFRVDQAAVDAIPQRCWPGDHSDISMAPAGIQRSILDGPFEVEKVTNTQGQLVPALGPGGQPIAVLDADGRAVQNPNQTDLFNPWCVDTLKDSDEWFSPKVNLDWQITDNALAYFTWASARKPGGFSLLTVGSSGLDRDLTEFKPEKMQVWETGAKTSWFENSLVLNGALFFQDFTDKQALTSALGNDGRLVSKVENAGSAEVWGLELSAFWSPASQFLAGSWTLNGGVTWLLESEYTDFRIVSGSPVNAAVAGNCTPIQVGANLLCELNYSGKDLENSPPLTFNGFVNYTIPVGPTVDGFIESDIIYQDRRFTNFTNNLRTEAFWNFDLRVGVNSDRWEALLYVNNLLDNRTVVSAGGGPGIGCCFVLGSGLDLATPAVPTAAVMVDLPLFSTAFLVPPRVVGFRWAYRFGG